MRWIFYIAIIGLLSSCGARQAVVEKTKLSHVDKGTIEMKAPGAFVNADLAMPLRERPRNQTKVFTGSFGAKSIATFDSLGIVTSVLTICPEINILKQENSELKYQLKQKDVERKGMSFGSILLISIGCLLIGIIIGWILRGRIKIPGLG